LAVDVFGGEAEGDVEGGRGKVEVLAELVGGGPGENAKVGFVVIFL
jgi:hypothetical protein